MWKAVNPRSLRSRIVLLALFACLLLCAAGTSFIFFLNSSQKAKLDTAQKHLAVLAGAMRSDYLAQLPHGFSLDQVESPPPPHPPPPSNRGEPPPPPPPSARPPHPPQPPQPLGDGPLAQVTTSVLRRESDVEGGFYAARSSALVGYAFPTHLGPGGQSEIPEKEKPAIEDLVRKAVVSGVLQTQKFHGDYDAILFVAIPIVENQQSTGAAWLMQRMPGLEAGRSKQLLLGSLGFTTAAIACALLTFFIMSEVNTGVYAVLARLGSMEGALGEHGEAGGRPQLAEFQLVLERVDHLSDSLKQKIETQRALEDEIRHRQRLSALGQFAAGVAHELRNPLATIQLRTQMSKRGQDHAIVERNCDVVLDEVTRLNTMIERLLYFSRPIHLQLKPVSITNLCRQCEEAWATRCRQENVRFSCETPDDLIALCDAGTIRQVLDNLLDNALQSVLSSRATDREIGLQCGEAGEVVQIEVRDNGAGLKQEAEARALEPFFTTKDTGTGLGLSISYEIAQAHGGDLHLRNHENGGAVVILSLPQPTATVAHDSSLSTQEVSL